MLREYEQKLKIARETGIGIAIRFQENPNYPLDKEYKCPHCGASHGIGENGEWVRNTKVGENYEIPSDIKFMCNNVGYAWTEDVKCANCGEMFSLGNGC